METQSREEIVKFTHESLKQLIKEIKTLVKQESDKLATPDYVNKKISDLVNSSPEALDTLKELADAIGNDPNFSNTILDLIGQKASTEYVNTELSNKADNEDIPTNVSQLNNDANYVASEKFKSFSYDELSKLWDEVKISNDNSSNSN